MNREEFEEERKASAERRRRQFESLRRPPPLPDGPEVRRLTAAEKLKLRDEEYVIPRD